ncbi:MAG: sorbosone dehydrogenase family protein, partial [Proteobacteria bacterium]
ALGTPELPPPDESHEVKNYSKVIGWPEGKMPTAPTGFAVSKFADGLRNPRWIYQAPNGDIFVAEAETEPKGKEAKKSKKPDGKGVTKKESVNEGGSANRITLFRDADKDGKFEIRQTYLEKLNQPFGMLIVGNSFYVGNTDSVQQFPYKPEQTKITAKGKKIRSLPAGGYNNHWTRNLIAAPDGKSIFVSVGSGSNVGENGMENEKRRANILQISLDGKTEKIFASGLRNPVGMGFAPQNYTSGNTNGGEVLFTAVNERDNLGDDLVPDYLTSVQEGGFYGWPYAYFGANEDPRQKGKNPELVKKTIVPDVALGSHTASLGLAFYSSPKNGTSFPDKYHGGAFIGQHGSWNRAKFSGYKVVFVPFKDGKPNGAPEDFLTGFIANDHEVYGRPVGVTNLQDGSLLVADDSANTIWQVRKN